MIFPAIEAAFEASFSYAKKKEARNPEIESFLARYLLVLIYAEYEKRLGDLLNKRIQACKDEHIATFAKYARQRIFRGITIADLSEILGRLGRDYKEQFARRVRGSTVNTAYSAIVSNRHKVAHGDGVVPLTLDDLHSYFKQSLTVLTAFQEALGLF
ncbi:MAG: hypothetical protein HY706_20280 [Candidatus Hydrogenedentes bacterium]|nr:hypothetical protein [Candidatus Hydrogenedentota bacterium]